MALTRHLVTFFDVNLLVTLSLTLNVRGAPKALGIASSLRCAPKKLLILVNVHFSRADDV